MSLLAHAALPASWLPSDKKLSSTMSSYQPRNTLLGDQEQPHLDLQTRVKFFFLKLFVSDTMSPERKLTDIIPARFRENMMLCLGVVLKHSMREDQQLKIGRTFIIAKLCGRLGWVGYLVCFVFGFVESLPS